MHPTRKPLTLELLKQRLAYNPKTGVWQWLRSNNACAKKPAGHMRPDGYRQLIIDGVCYFSGRLAWFYMTSEWPQEQIDHINRNRADDRWSNLREATWSNNMANRKLHTNNTSGYRGVSWDNTQQKWDVRVNRLHIGWYDDLEEAVAVRDRLAQGMQGSFAVLNQQGEVT